LARLAEELARSIALRQARRCGVPPVRFDNELPVTAKRLEKQWANVRH